MFNLLISEVVLHAGIDYKRPPKLAIFNISRVSVSPGVISRNELDFSQETGDAFHRYRVFQFRTTTMFYMLRGDVSKQLNLEPIDFRASFRKVSS